MKDKIWWKGFAVLAKSGYLMGSAAEKTIRKRAPIEGQKATASLPRSGLRLRLRLRLHHSNSELKQHGSGRRL